MAWENPERSWERSASLGTLDRGEIERRIGSITGSMEILPGGLANLNVRVDDTVLRIYRRDPAVVQVEAALLRRGWTSFRVPRILGQGADYLLLEYVPHEELDGTAEEGAAVGRALAEIHSIKFNRAGLLGPDLRVSREFPDFLAALRSHASTELRAGPLADLHESMMEMLGGLSDAGPPTLLHGDWKGSNLKWSARGLLVLDWEFAYAGAALMDVGQLLRWRPPTPFVEAFAEAYGQLPEGWQRQAELFDLVNLAGLSARATSESRRSRDVRGRILRTLS
jgi:fructosamine-3-kinase